MIDTKGAYMQSPFLYDSVAKGKNFFGRATELKFLDKIVAYSNNALIFSKRRMDWIKGDRIKGDRLLLLQNPNV